MQCNMNRNTWIIYKNIFGTWKKESMRKLWRNKIIIKSQIKDLIS